MSPADKVAQLRQLIEEKMTPFISNDYWLLGVPYHSNVGDHLIWQGELDFLKRFPVKCKGIHSQSTFTFPAMDRNDVIFINGGGSFGDVWPESFAFMMSIVEHYSSNKIVFFPQSVQFFEFAHTQMCVEKLRKHGNVFVCVRDRYSYEFLFPLLGDKIVLVPDMAFFLDVKQWRHQGSVGDKAVLIYRNDRELKDATLIGELLERKDVAVVDWPPMNSDNIVSRAFYITLDYARNSRRFIDFLGRYIYKTYAIYAGIRLIARASHVYTTRLHGGILGILLGKEVTLFDNSYGKCRRLFETWLIDCDGVKLLN